MSFRVCCDDVKRLWQLLWCHFRVLLATAIFSDAELESAELVAAVVDFLCKYTGPQTYTFQEATFKVGTSFRGTLYGSEWRDK